jgi:hypothetical protein
MCQGWRPAAGQALSAEATHTCTHTTHKTHPSSAAPFSHYPTVHPSLTSRQENELPLLCRPLAAGNRRLQVQAARAPYRCRHLPRCCCIHCANVDVSLAWGHGCCNAVGA